VPAGTLLASIQPWMAYQVTRAAAAAAIRPSAITVSGSMLSSAASASCK
jgi:hypothetical protein